MSLNEFKKMLGADPLEREPENRLAKPSGAEFDEARREALSFESKLRAALEAPAPDEGLLGTLLEIPSRQGSNRRWLGMAAGVIIAVGVAGVLWNQAIKPGSLDEHVAWHYGHDGARVLNMAGPDFDMETGREILAQFDFTASAEMQQHIRFVKICPGYKGDSAHMIVQTQAGMISIILLPGNSTSDHMLEFDGMQAYMVALDGATVAIIGRPEQHVASYGDMVRAALTHIS